MSATGGAGKRYPETRINASVLAHGAEFGSAPNVYEALKLLCTNIVGGIVPRSGHYIPEDESEALTSRIVDFLAMKSA